jgi:hypothetical protein
MADDRREAFDAAAADAEAVLEATAAAMGAENATASRSSDLVIVLRIVGPGKARDCGHLTRPDVVYLHSATGVHQCSACSSSPSTRTQIDAHTPAVCDSCGETAGNYSLAQFTLDNILVTAYICDECRSGRRAAVLPEWVRDLRR